MVRGDVLLVLCREEDSENTDIALARSGCSLEGIAHSVDGAEPAARFVDQR